VSDEVTEPEGPFVRFADQQFRVRERVSLAALVRFAHAAKSGSADEMDQWDAIYKLCAAALHPDEDTDRFFDAADRIDADEKTLMLFVRKVMRGETERPTSRPSDSSDGPQIIAENSEVDSSSPADLHLRVVQRLEAEGRPDKALMVLMAGEQQKASAA
jgi:hypothetical protein